MDGIIRAPVAGVISCMLRKKERSIHGHTGRVIIWLTFLSMLFSAPLVAAGWVLNDPYPTTESNQSIYYTSYTEQPKTLDPAKSYSTNEYVFVAQTVEPVLQYDYLTRPYVLVPLTATHLPEVFYFDSQKRPITSKADLKVAYSVYRIQIQPGIFFQPHPAFAKDAVGHYRYHALSDDYLDANHINELKDFKYLGTRELKADDYIYEIKRLATPAINSPIYGLMSEYIVGFNAFGKHLPQGKQFIDLRQYDLSGVRKLDDYTFEITIKGEYQQFLYWLAMPFFSPIPWEVDKFYAQPGMEDNNLGFSWYPVGTGPFMLVENNPNSRMMLEKNPNYRTEYGSAALDPGDEVYSQYRGKKLPIIDKAVFTLEKESIPRWNKFLQGYYDLSSISADSFDQAIRIDAMGKPHLTEDMKKKGLRLSRVNALAIYYLGFNMIDPVVGGRGEKARKLRLAISIAINFEEYISLFYNGRGHAAQGPLPPGIFGHRSGHAGMNGLLYTWDGKKPKRRSIKEAKQLLVEAGYPNGIDPRTGKPLVLHYDVAVTGGPDEKAQLSWMTKQFAQLGIDLDIRGTQYNRFQEKMRNGNAQIFSWGWSADYPDPENFLFQLVGKNSKVDNGGENASNYNNPQYDELFERMKNRKNDAQRQQLIDQMTAIVRYDAPWVWGIHTETFLLSQSWVAPIKWNALGTDTLKYMSIDVSARNKWRSIWNQPILWPLGWLLVISFLLLFPFLFAYYRKQQSAAPRLP